MDAFGNFGYQVFQDWTTVYLKAGGEVVQSRPFYLDAGGLIAVTIRAQITNIRYETGSEPYEVFSFATLSLETAASAEGPWFQLRDASWNAEMSEVSFQATSDPSGNVLMARFIRWRLTGDLIDPTCATFRLSFAAGQSVGFETSGSRSISPQIVGRTPGISGTQLQPISEARARRLFDLMGR